MSVYPQLWDFIFKGLGRKQFTPDGSMEEPFKESTMCRYSGGVKEAHKEWEATQRLAAGGAVTT